MFSFILGDRQQLSEGVNIKTRTAIRGVIIRKDKILMVFTNKGDYKFPGGGLIDGENYIETLKREVREETGYMITEVKEKLGEVIERNADTRDNNITFEMTSQYYLCDVSNNISCQSLDAYEVELDFKATWIKIDEALKYNEKLIQNETEKKNPWIYRETEVLKQIKKIIS